MGMVVVVVVVVVLLVVVVVHMRMTDTYVNRLSKISLYSLSL